MDSENLASSVNLADGPFRVIGYLFYYLPTPVLVALATVVVGVVIVIRRRQSPLKERRRCDRSK